MNPDRLCAWDEKIGIFGGRPELSTALSPVVDNLQNLWKLRYLRLTFASTIEMHSPSL